MKIKTMISGILLLFVGTSIGYLVIGESQRAQTAEEQPAQSTIETAQKDNMIDNGSEKKKAPEHQVIAYYFHGTRRCVTCQTIEAYAEESLRGEFSGELESGKLVWQPVNVDTPENKHFIQDYQLTTRSVVLVEMLGGKQKQWKNLSQVWALVRDKPAFIAHIQEETKKLLGK